MDKELSHIALFAFRYALPRETSAPHVVSDFIQARADQLDQRVLAEIGIEISEEIARSPEVNPDANYTRRVWIHLLNWINARLYPDIEEKEKDTK